MAQQTGAAVEPLQGQAPPGAGRSRWAPLDGLRGVAVLLVVVAHAGDLMWPEASMWMAQGGHLGVHLFFVLSGFLITVLLLTEAGRHHGRIAIGAFAHRRVLRLVPALAVYLSALQMQGLFGSRMDPLQVLSTAVHALTFTINHAAVHGSVPVVSWLAPGDGLVRDGLHTWSLAVEVHFYLLWGLTLWWLARRRTSWTSMALVAGGGIVLVSLVRAWLVGTGARHPQALYFETWPRLDAPLVGALAGIAFVAGWSSLVSPRVLTWAGLLGGLGFLVAAFTVGASAYSLPLGLYTLLAVGTAATVLAGVQGVGHLSKVLAWRPLCWFGTISYSLYLWHFGVFMMFERRTGEVPPGLAVVVGIAVAVGLAWLSYRFVEQPFLRRRGTPAPAPAPAPAPVPARTGEVGATAPEQPEVEPARL